MAAVNRAHVFLNSNKEAVIFPPVIVAKKNEEIEIVNLTDNDIAILYPQEVFDDAGSNLDPKKSAEFPGKGKPAKKKVHNGANTKLGKHPLQVFCYETNTLARGNSDPMIIIEP